MIINGEKESMEVRVHGLLDGWFGGTEETRKNIKRYPKRDLNRIPPEYK
jgi:hypothetical protein